MCELALFDTSDRDYVNRDDDDEDGILQYIADMYAKNSDGLGLVAIYPDGDRFSYETMNKGSRPDEREDRIAYLQDVMDFLEENEEAWRVAVHARLATCGKIEARTAHPIELDCPETDIDFVLHNGVVNNYSSIRTKLESQGHEFATEVDSEAIPHEHGTIPDSIDEVEGTDLVGTLNYFLFNEEGILVRSTTRYRDDPENFRLSRRSKRKYISDSDSADRSSKWMLVKPDRSIETDEIYSSSSVWSGWSSRGGSSSSTSKSKTGGRDRVRTRRGGKYSRRKLGDEEDEEDEGIDGMNRGEMLKRVGETIRDDGDVPTWWEKWQSDVDGVR